MGSEVKRIGKHVHLGCGLTTPTDWINIDGSWNARLAKYPSLIRLLRQLHIVPDSQLTIPWNPDILIHDLRKPLPFTDNSVDAIYSSHTLEHLYLNEAQTLLTQCLRVLRPGGILRIVVPDLNAIIAEYNSQQALDSSPAEIHQLTPADRINRRLLLRHPAAPSGNIIYRLYTALFDFHSHKWMYDAESLTYYFQKVGFTNIQSMSLHQSRIPGIEQVELPERVINGAGICIEGIKPELNGTNA